MKRVRAKDVYHILWCLSSQLELDLFDSTKPNFGIPKSFNDICDIIFYLNDCPCKSCRDGVKTLNKWIKEIHDLKSFYRITPIKRRGKRG